MHIFKIITVSDRTEDKLETTRWVVKTNVQDTTWDDLIKRLQRLFSTRSSQFFVSWYDGTDYCSIRDWQDLQEAVEFFAESNDNQDRAIRLYASLTKRDLPTVFAEGPPHDDDLATELHFSTIEHSELETPIDQQSVISGEINSTEASVLADEITDMLETTDVHSDEEHVSVDTGLPIEHFEDQKQLPQQTPFPVAAAAPSMTYPSQPMGQPMSPYNYYGMGPLPQMYPMMYPQWSPMITPGQQPPQAPVMTQTNQNPVAPVAAAVEQKYEQGISETPKCSNTPCPLSSLIKDVPQPTIEAVPSDQSSKIKASSKKDGAKSESHKAGSKSQFIKVALDSLRAMGYTYDEKKLKPVIKAKKGNLNEIIDEINKW